MSPTDPQYNHVRALYTSMMIEAHRWDFFHSHDASTDTDATSYDDNISHH